MNEAGEPVGGSDGRRRTRRAGFAVFVLLASALAIIPLAGAASGDLDLLFGNQGTVIDPLEVSSIAGDGGTWAAHAVVFDPRTSQIFVVGSDATAAEGDHVSVAASFSSDGSRLWHRTRVPPSARSALTYADAAVMHPIDGALVVAGLSRRVVSQGGSELTLYVTRIAPDGTILTQPGGGCVGANHFAD
ncbi:MAG: hypothetical protein M3Q30_15695 [Actinomycetota bacterium]|nr:hypothetical protein [Actinomycetota bacterium]